MVIVKPEKIQGFENHEIDTVRAAIEQAYVDADEILGEIEVCSACVVNTPQASGITLSTKAFAVTKVTVRTTGEEDGDDNVAILDPGDYELTPEGFTVRLTKSGARFGIMGEAEFLPLAETLVRVVQIIRLVEAILAAEKKGEVLSAATRADILYGI